MQSSPAFQTPLLRFPEEFQFGVATAAHQVEGHNHTSDWWTFEQEAGRIHDGTQSGAACEHYTRFREDLELISALSCTVYRFSIEWAKVEPEPGRFDPAVLAHYREVILACRAKGIEPLVTLYHFTLPRWFADRGNWLSPESVDAFTRYVRAVRDALGDLVTWWCTINEPVVYMYHAWLTGVWPPAHKSFLEMSKVGRHLILGHIAAYKVLHEKEGYQGKPVQVGIAKHLRVFDPWREGSRADAWAAAQQEYGFNWAFLDSLEQGRFRFPLGLGEKIPGAIPCQDYLGINYYTRDRVQFAVSAALNLFGVSLKTPHAPLNDLSWEIYPEGLTRLLRTAYRRYGKHIWITENGLADASDRLRPAFVAHHMTAVARSLEEGVPLLGYCHWSLYDNFEWAEGYTPRFGLYAVDYQTQARTLRPGGALYGQIAREKALSPSLVEQYPLLG